MRKPFSFSISCLLLLSVAVLPVSCFKNLTQVIVVYENSFENDNRDPLEVITWNSTGTSIGPVSDTYISNYHGTHVLGKFNNGAVVLAADELPPHQILRAEFDLYIHDIWKNDLWKIAFDGTDQLLTGFSNDSTVQQSYPNWLGNGSALSPAGKNAIDINLPGACTLVSSTRGTSMYRITITTPHTNNKISIVCSDAGGFFNDTCKRSWSIDNYKLSVIKNY